MAMQYSNSLSYTQALVQSAPKASGAELGTALFTYKIAAPLSIGRQKSAMIPFVSSPVQAQAVSIFNPEVQAAHPLLGARLKNTSGLHLMGGPLTVFDEGAGGRHGVCRRRFGRRHGAGADPLDFLRGRPRSWTRTARISPGKSQVFAVKLYQGNLIVKTHCEQSHLYTVKNNSDKPRTGGDRASLSRRGLETTGPRQSR